VVWSFLSLQSESAHQPTRHGTRTQSCPARGSLSRHISLPPSHSCDPGIHAYLLRTAAAHPLRYRHQLGLQDPLRAHEVVFGRILGHHQAHDVGPHRYHRLDRFCHLRRCRRCSVRGRFSSLMLLCATFKDPIVRRHLVLLQCNLGAFCTGLAVIRLYLEESCNILHRLVISSCVVKHEYYKLALVISHGERICIHNALPPRHFVPSVIPYLYTTQPQETKLLQMRYHSPHAL